MIDYLKLRTTMVDRQLKRRGIENPDVLQAMQTVPREEFVPADLAEFAYMDTPLPIGDGQTISQPYIVALMTELLEPTASDRALEIGTGSGYAAAVLSRVVRTVFSIERHAGLLLSARECLQRRGYDNVHLVHGDGSLGLAAEAPFDAILVAAGAPEVPAALKAQLAVGGRLVVPIGPTPRSQTLVRVRRTGPETFSQEEFDSVRFVPLVGEAGWQEGTARNNPDIQCTTSVTALIGEAAEIIPNIEEADIRPLLERIGEAKLVLLGEGTHGTAEFYSMRARISRELIRTKGFNIVAIEADWPDAADVNRYISGIAAETAHAKPFERFPAWMWGNRQFADFVEWLRQYNAEGRFGADAIQLYGLDLYSLHASIAGVLTYLDDVDPDSARIARRRYGCLTPWQTDPAAYGAAALSGRYRECEAEAVALLKDLLNKRLAYMQHDGSRFLDAEHNARLITQAEPYYRAIYYGGNKSWNLRDRHMFDMLRRLLAFHGPNARAVVWEHNSHVGDAAATEMGRRGEENLGQLCRQTFGRRAYLLGFGTDHGTVAAAAEWGGPMGIETIRPAHPDSYEHVCHNTGIPAYVLPLNTPQRQEVRQALARPRLERAIGVIYAPETELASHYFYATLPDQFDDYIWFDETKAVTPLSSETRRDLPATSPFGY
jgi:protein-L-isoaspartate(D-aspartate) O-methyltransferase